MYVRVKRQKTTYFIRCNPFDKVQDIKSKLHALTHYAIGDQRLILLDSHHVLVDACMLSHQQVFYHHLILYIYMLCDIIQNIVS